MMSLVNKTEWSHRHDDMVALLACHGYGGCEIQTASVEAL